LTDFEGRLRDDFGRDQLDHLIHAHLQSAWEMLTHFAKAVDDKKFSLDDKLMLNESYTREVAGATVEYLEKDFQQNTINSLVSDRNGRSLTDPVTRVDFYVSEIYNGLL
jgi:hypothetical protein